MTQMTFFDSPAFTTSATAAPATVAPAVTSPSPVTSPSSRQSTPASAPALENRVSSPDSARPDSARPVPARSASGSDLGDGVHHMSDLARLVILRYQLVAKRRAEMAAKRPR